MIEKRPTKQALEAANSFGKLILEVYNEADEEIKLKIEEKLSELDYTVKGKDPYRFRIEAGMGKKLFLCTYEKE